MRGLAVELGLPRRDALVLLLALGLPALLLLLAGPVPRLDADAVEYYSHLRSLYFDRDLDFANEFEHFGILSRWDKRQPTATGHRRTIFSVGPALLWLPFYAAADLAARAAGTPLEDGYSPLHIRAVTLASPFYGLLGLLLVYGVLREVVSRAAAFWTVLLLLHATFLVWYLSYEPVMSHAPSFFLSALVLRVFWTGGERPGLGRAAALGLLIGLAATVRWQNAVLLLLPAAALGRELGRAPRSSLVRAAFALAAFALGCLPQMLAWKAVFGSYLLADPPHGRDFLRLDHPFLLETFFSSRHGLLYWTPVLWAGFLGSLALARRRPFAGLAILPPLAVMSYVNACSGDWWAGGSFSNRRFDSALPLLALGLGVALDALLRLAARRPTLLLGAGAGLLAAWNALFMAQYGQGLVPRDFVVSFPAVAEGSAGLLARALGTPLAWPANWIFARRHGLPAERYDLMVGKYLFYRQNNLGGVLDLGDERVDAALLAEGWAPPTPCGEASCRAVEGRARLFAALDLPEALDLRVRASGAGSLAIAVNGHPLGEVPLGPELSESRLRIAGSLLRRELNELALEPGPGGRALVERLVFVRLGGSRGAP